MNVSSRSVLTAALAATVAAAAYVDRVALLVVIAIIAVGVGVGWPDLIGSPMVGGSRLVVAMAGVGGVLTVFGTQSSAKLQFLPVVLAMAVVLAFVAELLRTDGRDRLVDSLIGTVSGTVVAVSCAGWIATAWIWDGAAIVVLAAIGIAAASAVAALRVPEWVRAVGGVVVAGGLGFWIGTVLPEVSSWDGLGVGLVSGLLVVGLHLLFDRLPDLSGRLGAISYAALPIALGGVLVFVAGRIAG